MVTNYDDKIYAGDGDDTVFGGQGDDTIDGGTGNDTIDGGTGSDTFTRNESSGADVIQGGEDGDGNDIDVLDASGVTTGGVSVSSTNEEGSLTQGPNTATFSEIESFTLTDQNDSFSA